MRKTTGLVAMLTLTAPLLNTGCLKRNPILETFEEKVVHYGHTDDDQDGTILVYDNCPYTFNPDQSNRDNDGYGDACDPEPDIAHISYQTAKGN